MPDAAAGAQRTRGPDQRFGSSVLLRRANASMKEKTQSDVTAAIERRRTR